MCNSDGSYTINIGGYRYTLTGKRILDMAEHIAEKTNRNKSNVIRQMIEYGLKHAQLNPVNVEFYRVDFDDDLDPWPLKPPRINKIERKLKMEPERVWKY